jgi:phenylpyruvate tautomerase PptA (4-oxalocrotonate tautomerase family)
MPTYLCTIPAGSLAAAQKGAIAKAITRVHSEVTGAPGFFAEVIFKEVSAGDWFIGGEPLAGEQIFVHGNIRGGRPPEMRHALIARLAAEVGQAARLPAHAIWIYLSELQPRAMVEFGHVLPEPGDEAAWTAALPAADRERMQAIGRGGQRAAG